jgi:threonine/homoserine/homoserine lactone efflux protein
MPKLPDWLFSLISLDWPDWLLYLMGLAMVILTGWIIVLAWRSERAAEQVALEEMRRQPYREPSALDRWFERTFGELFMLALWGGALFVLVRLVKWMWNVKL